MLHSKLAASFYTAALIVLSAAIAGLLLAHYFGNGRNQLHPPGQDDSSPAAVPTHLQTAQLFKPAPNPAPGHRKEVEESTQLPAPARSNQAEIKQRPNATQIDSRFTRVDYDGGELQPDAQYWFCARDLQTGLLWEVKKFDAGLRDAEHTYSWYMPGASHAGRMDGGHCYGTRCDTDAYIDAIRQIELCGASDWRLPTFHELESLIDRNYYNPTINQEIFPHTSGTIYWTSTELENNPGMVMQVDFFNGFSHAVPKNLSYSLRLVSAAAK